MHNLIEYLETTYSKHGDKLAVEAADGELSFAQLRNTALRLGAAISNRCGADRIKKPIVVYMPKGSKCLCAMLGILYSANVYVPMDCRAPINRTKLIIETIDPILIITDEAGCELLTGNDVPERLIARFDELNSHTDQIPDEHVARILLKTQDADPANILFTSGSTGIPKGVVIPHRRIISYINWARGFFSIKDSEVIGNQAPFYFTVSVTDIYLCLATGSKLCIIPEDRFSRPNMLIQYLNEHKITMFFWVASVYHHIAKADAMSETVPRFLKHALFAGEPMAAPSLSYWIEKLPDVEFTHIYGSTETEMTMCYRVPKGVPIDKIPLGRACANTEILLLKEDLTAAKPGEIADIYVRGTLLALGYYKDLEKTRASFIQNPLHSEFSDIIYKTGDLGELRDGLIFFHGRRDHQFKHLGYRIEAGEIESAASKYPQIKNTCVVYDGDRRQIVLFYESDGEIDEHEYCRAMMSDLPIYMVPTRLVRLDVMPLNANRKKDRLLLKAKYIEKGND